MSSAEASNALSVTIVRERTVIENTFEITGTVFEISEVKTYPSGFKRRELVLLTDDYRPQPITFQFLSERVDLLNGIGDGERIIVRFRLEGRSWEDRYLTNLTVFELLKTSEQRIEGLGDESFLESK